MTVENCVGYTIVDPDTDTITGAATCGITFVSTTIGVVDIMGVYEPPPPPPPPPPGPVFELLAAGTTGAGIPMGPNK